jgi:hypothetical protein
MPCHNIASPNDYKTVRDRGNPSWRPSSMESLYSHVRHFKLQA